MTCRQCKHYNLAAVQDAAGRVKKDWAAICLFDVTTLFDQLPKSVPAHAVTGIRPRHMEPNDGEGCPQFLQR